MEPLPSLSYFGVFFLVGLESIGIPLPGETALITASVYAGITDELNIWYVLIAAASGAIVGDNIGYWIGRKGGYVLLRKFGKRIHIDEKKLKVGEYLFTRYGGRVVFFGRFFSLLRIFAAFLAGVNRMQWQKFLVFNAAGAICWAMLIGLSAYTFGQHIAKVNLLFRIVTTILGFIIFFGVTYFIKVNEQRLEIEAEKVMSGSSKV